MDIGEGMDSHTSRRNLRHRRKNKYDNSPILPPQGGTSTSKHPPASHKLTIAPEPSAPRLSNPPMPSSPLSNPLEPSEQEVHLETITDLFKVPFAPEDALRQQNLDVLQHHQAKLILYLKILFKFYHLIIIICKPLNESFKLNKYLYIFSTPQTFSNLRIRRRKMIIPKFRIVEGIF
uniref:Uncharacterized protein n=1 Tax=Meloidogyne incognita TaxID=6306 RepID=A0A914MCF6_MELIC